MITDKEISLEEENNEEPLEEPTYWSLRQHHHFLPLQMFTTDELNNLPN